MPAHRSAPATPTPAPGCVAASDCKAPPANAAALSCRRSSAAARSVSSVRYPSPANRSLVRDDISGSATIDDVGVTRSITRRAAVQRVAPG